MTLPQSSTATYFLIPIFPVCGSTSTTQMWVPKGKVKLDGSNMDSAERRGSMNDHDIVHLDAQLIGDDLRKGGLLPLPVRRRARQGPHFPGGFHLHLAVLPHSLGSHGADLDIRR